MVTLGAFVASLSSLGNEPQFCCSFASGLSMRIFFSTDFVRALPLYQSFTEILTDNLQTNLFLIFDQVEDLITNASSGIGDCGGGFYRSMAADAVTFGLVGEDMRET